MFTLRTSLTTVANDATVSHFRLTWLVILSVWV